jgi:hypothetical protein
MHILEFWNSMPAKWDISGIVKNAVHAAYALLGSKERCRVWYSWLPVVNRPAYNAAFLAVLLLAIEDPMPAMPP